MDYSVCIVEKGSEVGAHILSGAILEPKALDELIENWREIEECPVKTAVTQESLKFLTKKNHLIYQVFLCHQLCIIKGNFIISLGSFCKWLSQQAEELGVEIYPGFAASDILSEDEKLKGIVTGDLGLIRTEKEAKIFNLALKLRLNTHFSPKDVEDILEKN